MGDNISVPHCLGDPGASRTHNLFLRTELLYPLSYRTPYILYHELNGYDIMGLCIRLKV